jgi:hypothetical protein
MKMKTLQISSMAILSLVFFIGYHGAFACSCAVAEGPLTEAEKSTVVFMGKVTELERDSSGELVGAKFSVEKTWKGVSNNQVNVSTGPYGDCTYQFKMNETYVVYAHGNSTLSTDLCTGTKILADSYEDLQVLGIGNPVPEFPFAEIVLVAGIASLIAFYRFRLIRK